MLSSQTKYRDPAALPRITDRSVIERFERFLILVRGSRLWVWGGAACHRGYGKFKYAGRMLSAHRIAYAIYKGPLTSADTINHLPVSDGLQPHKLNCHPDCLEIATLSHNSSEGASRTYQRWLAGDYGGICARCRGKVLWVGRMFKCIHCGCNHAPIKQWEPLRF